MSTYEQSGLWKRTLASQGAGDAQAKARERLRTAFEKTREQVTPLIAKIGHELPMLTVHDITHIDSLWLVADTLMGDDYPINPAEVFVLGMAFLLHDAATSSFAYPGGIDGLRQTTQWRDLVAQKQLPDEAMAPGEYGYKFALFETLRLLHPHQAERLLGQTWADPDGKSHRLLGDQELVNTYGAHIGKIAASHGKDIAEAERAWANAPPLPPPPSIAMQCPGEDWTVDRLKLAMLLRCIDAAHIDSYRAPDFLMALNAPSGESQHHWSFQNKLTALAITPQNLIYWSGQIFEERHSEAWWRCYDAMAMIDREIRNANKILAQNRKPTLRAVGVLGANDIDELRKHIPTQGWHPLDIRYRISHIGHVIEKFGGAALYGDKPYLALRELLQNAVDAIHARRIHRGSSMVGTIEVALEDRGDDCWLHVVDDGIGMSRYVLTEVLLDFGRSLWSDAALREQWQGLAAKGFQSMGQFGIGFFSVFMLGDEVKITTWRDGDAEAEQSTLHIRDRFNARPMLLDTAEADRLQQVGTRVSVKLKGGRDCLLPIFKARYYYLDSSINDRPSTLAELVGMLAPAVDIDVKTREGNAPSQICVRANDWKTISNAELMSRIAPAIPEKYRERVDENIIAVREPEGALVGRIGLGETAIREIGLSVGITVNNGILAGFNSFRGLLLSRNNQDLARFRAVPIASPAAMRKFAEEYLRIDHASDEIRQSWKYLSLGVDYRQLRLAIIDDVAVRAHEITEHAHNQFSVYGKVILAFGGPNCPEAISKSEFKSFFSWSSEVVRYWPQYPDRFDFGLGEWISDLFPEDENCPRQPGVAAVKAIEDAFPGCEHSWEDHVVGNVLGQDVYAQCLVLVPPGPSQEDLDQ